VNTIMRCLFHAGCGVFATLLLAATPALAEEAEADVAAAPAEAEPVDHLSGNLILNVDTNFMSYGFDVWQTGNFHDGLFHPQFDLKWDFGNGFNVFSGVWMDVNSNAASSISDDVQEVDVWLGAGYTYDKLSVSLTYQEWMYSFDSERIVDLGLAYDTFLAPSLTLHGRVEGIDGQGTGLIALFGIAHAFEFGEVTVKFPANVAFITKNYYQNDEGGFGYVSVGSVLSVPMAFIPEGYGGWTYNIGAYYYHTDTEVVGNRENNIVTATTGVALAF
jgi:hypothetical protein